MPDSVDGRTPVGEQAHQFGLTSPTALIVGSIIFDQAENRLHTIKAILVATLG